MVRNESGAKNREGTGLNVGLGDSQLTRVNSIVDLAGERLQPLGHLSGSAHCNVKVLVVVDEIWVLSGDFRGKI